MELKVSPYQLPEAIQFNFEELKTQIAEKTEHYARIVYTDENIKKAKTDRADLNRLKKALNDERIRRQKDYMEPFNQFKAQIDEIIAIIDKPVQAIDVQIKEYEAIKQDEKKMHIEEMFKNMDFPEWAQVEQLWNPKWLNTTFSMDQIEAELLEQRTRIRRECQTLAALPERSKEALHFYQKSLDISDAMSKITELAEMEKATKQPEEPVQIPFELEEPKVEEPKMWVAFEAYLTKTTAGKLKEFFEQNNIEFKPIKIKGE